MFSIFIFGKYLLKFTPIFKGQALLLRHFSLCLNFCRWFLEKLGENTVFDNKVLFTDKAIFSRISFPLQSYMGWRKPIRNYGAIFLVCVARLNINIPLPGRLDELSYRHFLENFLQNLLENVGNSILATKVLIYTTPFQTTEELRQTILFSWQFIRILLGSCRNSRKNSLLIGKLPEIWNSSRNSNGTMTILLLNE